MKKIYATLFACGLSLFVACGGQTTMSTKITGLNSLKGLSISVQTGTQGDDIAVSYSGKEKVVGFAKFTEAILALKQGKVQATFMDGLPAEQIVKMNPDLYIWEEALQADDYAIALQLGNDELKKVVDSVIEKLQAENQIDKFVTSFQENEEEASKALNYNAEATGGELIVGTEAGFAPYETKLGDKIVGSDILLAQEIAKKLNKKLTVIDMDFDALIPAVKAGKIDMAIAGMSVTAEREKEILFSKPYFSAKQVAVIRAADKN